MAGLSGIVKKISDLVTGTPADDDCFIFGKTDLKKITLAKLKDALGITSINFALGGFKFIESSSTGDNGSTSITMTKNLEMENIYIIFVRNLNGSVECYAPYAYLFYIRSNSWHATTVGDPVDVDKISIQGGKFTISFKTNQWARMWVYKIS